MKKGKSQIGINLGFAASARGRRICMPVGICYCVKDEGQ